MADEGRERRYRILVVDDEPRIVRFVRLNLEQDGYETYAAYTGKEALDKVRELLPDLVLLDVMLPDMDGFEVLKMIRQISDVPVIMLTARSDEEDIIRGLELGADDYITKPFSPRVLSSRIKAVLRRYQSAMPEEVIEVDDRLKIDLGRREVWVEGKLVKLRPTEFRLLYHLVKNAGWVMTYEQLLHKVWGLEYENEHHYVRLYVNYLRQKLEKDPSNPQYILTERGVGYRFVDYKRLRKQRTADSSQQATDSGQRSVDGGQQAADSRRQSADSGQRTADSAQRTADSSQQ